MTTISSIDTTVQKTKALFQNIIEAHDLIENEEQAYAAYCAVMTTLRDRLPVESVNAIAAQLTPLARGFFYEGWQPGVVPIKMDKAEFEIMVVEKLSKHADWPVSEIIEAVVVSVGAEINPAILSKIKDRLPDDVVSLLP